MHSSRSFASRISVHAGTFSHGAVARHFGDFVEAEPYASIDEVFRAAESGQTDHAVVPVENSTEGAVGRTLDLMCQTELNIVGEIKLRIAQQLLSNAGTTRWGHQHLFAHPVARAMRAVAGAASCLPFRGYLLRATPKPHDSQQPNPAPRQSRATPAATIYGLSVLRAAYRGRTEQHDALLGAGSTAVARSGRDETSLVMSAHNRPGAVHALLEPFAKHGVSMSRLESRPARTGLWEYLFFVDLEGHRDDAPVAAALTELRARAPFLKLLGSYPAAPVLK